MQKGRGIRLSVRTSAQQYVEVCQALLELREGIQLLLGRFSFCQAGPELAVLRSQACQLFAHIILQFCQAGDGICLQEPCTTHPTRLMLPQ